MIIPILITFDSKALDSASEMNQEYIDELAVEIEPLVSKFINDSEFSNLELRLLFLPTATKKALLKRFDKIIRGVSHSGDVEDE